MQYFYLPEIVSGQYFFDKNESRHIAKVLRIQAGTDLIVVDGQGGKYLVKLEEVFDKKVSFSVLEKEEVGSQRNYFLHLLVAPTKNIDRMEWLFEKACELGVDRITPILCQHSERKVIKPERLEKILVAAMKQSQKALLPQLDALCPILEAMQLPFDGKRSLAYCEDKPVLSFTDQVKAHARQQIFIGPEGDFSPNELKAAAENKIEWVHLGQSRLRTETAALAAVHSCYLIHA